MGNIVGKWFDNARSVALPQSLTPAILAAVMAVPSDGFKLLPAVLAVFGVAMAHLAVNLLDDYFDYKVDMAGDRDAVVRKGFRAMTSKYQYLKEGTSVGQLRAAIAVFGGLALLSGTMIMLYRGWTVAAVAAAGAVLGYFYSAPPLKLAYRGLGELVTGLIFGPLLMVGVYMSACGGIDAGILFISIPVGMLVLNILFTHSVIDLPADTESNKMTFARLIGSDRGNLAVSYMINLLPFVILVAGVVAGYLHPLALIALIALPRANWLCTSLRKFVSGDKDVTEVPSYLGRFENWEAISGAGLSWFMARWYCARNILTGLCSSLIVAYIVLSVIKFI